MRHLTVPDVTIGIGHVAKRKFRMAPIWPVVFVTKM
jgi:hypothetical protein